MTKKEAKTAAKLKLMYNGGNGPLTLENIQELLAAGSITQEMYDYIVS